MPQVRVLRLIEFVGPLKAINKQLIRSMTDGVHHKGEIIIKIATLDRYPEILDELPNIPKEASGDVGEGAMDWYQHPEHPIR